jgi:hypothetical protein
VQHISCASMLKDTPIFWVTCTVCRPSPVSDIDLTSSIKEKQPTMGVLLSDIAVQTAFKSIVSVFVGRVLGGSAGDLCGLPRPAP